jgi:DNA-binding response OmpR family regulator
VIMSIQNKKILIVDDDPVNLEFFQLMLSKLGFSVEEANDGLDAMEKLKKFRPDLILLDNIMPRMSGWELTKTLKQDQKFMDIPIIMFSALDDVKDKLAGFELGVDDYITKPFNFSEVLARIRTTLRNRELFAQIALREARLNLAEKLNQDFKWSLGEFGKSIDDLDAAISGIEAGGKPSDLANNIREKARKARGQLADLDEHLEKMILKWEDLKKNEIDLSALETQIRKFPSQE